MFETCFVDSVEKICCREVSVEDVKQEVLNLNVKKKRQPEFQFRQLFKTVSDTYLPQLISIISHTISADKIPKEQRNWRYCKWFRKKYSIIHTENTENPSKKMEIIYLQDYERIVYN